MCKIGKVYVIGLGPGAEKEMTYQASTALEKSEVIIGYTVYTGLIRERFPDKKYLSTPMRQEVIRCEMAMDEAMKGSTVAMVCSGDAGIYGMAGLSELKDTEVDMFTTVYIGNSQTRNVDGKMVTPRGYRLEE